MKNKKVKEKIIGTEIVEVSFNDYKNLRKNFPFVFKKAFLIYVILITVFCLLALIPPDPYSFKDFIEVFSYLLIIGIMFFGIIDILLLKTRYLKWLRNSGGKYNLCFYEDYIEKNSATINQTFKYEKIKRIFNRKFYLYLLLDDNQILYIKKRDDNNNLINYITSTVNLKNDNIIKKKYSTENNYNKVELFMNILFIVSFVSLWLVLYLINFNIKKAGLTGFLAYEKWNIALFFLPIPILSIILGFVFQKKGYKTLKNIILGFVITFIFVTFGSFWIVSNSYKIELREDEIKEFERIIGFKIPRQNVHFKVNWDTSFLDNHSTSYISFTDKTIAKAFYQQVENNEKWIEEKKLDLNLKSLIPETLECTSINDSCYYLTFIREDSLYNFAPLDSGLYHLYIMNYNPLTNTLQIESFNKKI